MGFAAIALTDHDTVAGIAEAREAARAHGVELIPAVEISTLEDERQIDMLGFGIDTADPILLDTLSRVRAGRFGRAEGMVQRLNDLGYPVSWERVQAIAGGENIGRPHVARAMVEAGIVPDVKSAFTDEFIANGGRCYVERVKISPEEAIALIAAAGGAAVIAHPGRSAITDDEVSLYASKGLAGIEAFYPQHDEARTAHFLALADRHGLVVTGGSDDHGDINEGRLMGTIRLPYAHVERLKARIAVA
jgi:predicted metal-dependent phosphoesterase TrpH